MTHCIQDSILEIHLSFFTLIQMLTLSLVSLIKKNTLGTFQLVGQSLIFWYSMKQNLVVLSTTKDECIVAGVYYSQVL